MNTLKRHQEEIESFDHEDLYDELMSRPYTRRLKDEVRVSIKKIALKEAHILEIGAGKSEFAGLFDKTNRVIVTDINCKLLSANDGSRFSRVLCDGEALPFKAGSFDLILFIGLLHHLIDQKTALLGARELLAKNGRVFICEPHRRSLNFFYWLGRRLFLRLFGVDRVRQMIGCFSPDETQLDRSAVHEVFGEEHHIRFRTFLTARLPPFRFFRNSTIDVRLSSVLDRLSPLPV